MHLLLVTALCGTTLPTFNNAFTENMSHLNLVSLATTYDLIRGGGGRKYIRKSQCVRTGDNVSEIRAVHLAN